ncbi:unnamed protein product, partial [Brenthis ino]
MNPHYHGYAELSSPHPPSPEAAFAANGHDYPHNNNNPALKECAGCGGKIVERFLLHALDRYWHHGCLKCTCCGQALADMGRSFYFKGGMILCKSDYTRMFGSSGACAACGQAIPASEFVMRTNAPQQPLHVFHIKCFACSKCGSHLMQGDRYYMLAGSLVCEQDWQKLMKSANATPGAPVRKGKVGRNKEQLLLCAYDDGQRRDGNWKTPENDSAFIACMVGVKIKLERRTALATGSQRLDRSPGAL